jgi:hypothetical protein
MTRFAETLKFDVAGISEKLKKDNIALELHNIDLLVESV